MTFLKLLFPEILFWCRTEISLGLPTYTIRPPLWQGPSCFLTSSLVTCSALWFILIEEDLVKILLASYTYFIGLIYWGSFFFKLCFHSFFSCQSDEIEGLLSSDQPGHSKQTHTFTDSSLTVCLSRSLTSEKWKKPLIFLRSAIKRSCVVSWIVVRILM